MQYDDTTILGLRRFHCYICSNASEELAASIFMVLKMEEVMEATNCFQTLVTIYHSTRLHITDNSEHDHHCKNINSQRHV
jgi:hypothetical protein